MDVPAWGASQEAGGSAKTVNLGQMAWGGVSGYPVAFGASLHMAIGEACRLAMELKWLWFSRV